MCAHVRLFESEMNYLSCWMAEQARLSFNVRLHVTHASRFDVSLQQQTVTVHTCRIIFFKMTQTSGSLAENEHKLQESFPNVSIG